MLIKSNINETTSKMMEEQKGNCAQAIFATYGPLIGLQKIDSNVCMSIAAAFGGGINRTGNVCGAITGALMVLGLKYGENIQEITRISNQFIDEFTAIHGSIVCRELIGDDLLNVENVRKAFQEGAFKKCIRIVNDAAKLLEKQVELEETSL
jgi:C_GCAxxG_C_C family probable redox protein